MFKQKQFSRVAHIRFFNHFLGDKMALEPRLSAFSLCLDIEEAGSLLKEKFTKEEWKNYHHLIKKNKIKTSSIGRVFDAVASLLGLLDKASYEGEAAILLQEEAMAFFDETIDIPSSWLQHDLVDEKLSLHLLLGAIVQKIYSSVSKREIAAWFHVQLAVLVKKVASGIDCDKICFSGGVFQNSLLTDIMIKILADHYKLYFNNSFSSNDENLSFGQLMWYTQNNITVTKKIN